ncbi:hypothetical protein ACOMHN_040946 [Nucella lapillus]
MPGTEIEDLTREGFEKKMRSRMFMKRVGEWWTCITDQSTVTAMAERPTGPHGYSLQSQSSAPGSLPTTIQQQPTPPGPQQQQQQQQSQHPASQQQQALSSPTKDVNAVNVCRVGQEMVHDIVSKAQEIFKLLSPNGISLNMNSAQYQEKKTKLDEAVTHISMQFRKLHRIHDKVLEIASQTDKPTPQQLVPEVGVEAEPVVANSNPEFYSMVVEEHREIVEQVRLKNQQLKELIDQIRTIIWEINTMITMRKTRHGHWREDK